VPQVVVGGIKFMNATRSPAPIAQKWAPVLRIEYAQIIGLEHFLAANRIPLSRKMLRLLTDINPM
jgi:hypothetical protein